MEGLGGCIQTMQADLRDCGGEEVVGRKGDNFVLFAPDVQLHIKHVTYNVLYVHLNIYVHGMYMHMYSACEYNIGGTTPT